MPSPDGEGHWVANAQNTSSCASYGDVEPFWGIQGGPPWPANCVGPTATLPEVPPVYVGTTTARFITTVNGPTEEP